VKELNESSWVPSPLTKLSKSSNSSLRIPAVSLCGGNLDGGIGGGGELSEVGLGPKSIRELRLLCCALIGGGTIDDRWEEKGDTVEGGWRVGNPDCEGPGV
jgi:hypothetical protein